MASIMSNAPEGHQTGIFSIIFTSLTNPLFLKCNFQAILNINVQPQHVHNHWVLKI